MRTKYLWVLFAIFLLAPGTLLASKLIPRGLGVILNNSSFVLIGTVGEVNLIHDRGLGGKEYEIEVNIAAEIKGSSPLIK